jgi:hypothetical protein
MINRELNAAFHWVGWCMPRRLVHQSLAALGCGVTHEDQCRNKVQLASTKLRIYRVMTQYQSEIVPVADHPMEIAAQQIAATEKSAEDEEKDMTEC